MTEGTGRPDRSAGSAEADEPGARGAGRLSLAVGYATAGRDALARHEEEEAILAYRYLRGGHDPARALWLAKQVVRASHPHVYRHPRTWAGFIILGAA